MHLRVDSAPTLGMGMQLDETRPQLLDTGTTLTGRTSKSQSVMFDFTLARSQEMLGGFGLWGSEMAHL